MSEAIDATESAIIQWIKTFEISRPVEGLQDLADGTILFQILSQVDSDWFKMNAHSLVRSDNWVFRYNNLKRLYELVSRYFEEKLGASFTRLPQVDLNLIAREGNADEIIQLCKYVLTVTVQSPDNTRLVQHITKLDKETREQIMQFVNETMQFNARRSVLSRRSTILQEDDGTAQIQTWVSRMTRDKQDLEIQNVQLIDEVSELNAKTGRFEKEIQSLKAKLEEKDKLIEQTQTELEKSQNDLQQKETQLQETIRELTDQNKQKISELQEQLVSRDQELEKAEDLLRSETQENDQLKVELDQLHERNETLKNDNETLEKECEKLKEHAEALEKENQSQHQHLETSHKHQVAELQSQNKELAEENNNLRDEIDQHLRMIADLESTTKTQTGDLETQNQELKQQVQDLQSENKALEDDNAHLQSQSEQYLQDIEDLTRELDNNLKRAADLEEQARATKKRRRSYLEPENEDNTAPSRRRIEQLENEVKALEDAVNLLENASKDGVPRNDFDLAEMKAKRLEEQFKKQLHELNKLALEKDVLETENKKYKDQLAEKERINKEIKNALQVIGQGDGESIRQQCAALTSNDVKLQEVQFKLKQKIQDLKQFVIEQDKMIKQAAIEAQGIAQNTEAVDSLKAEIQIYQTDIKRLKQRLEEADQQMKREQRLMLSCWYDVASRTSNKNTT